MRRNAWLLTLVAALVGAAPASAGWSDPETLAGPGRYLSDLVPASDGGVFAAWGRNATDDSAWARAGSGAGFGAPDAFASHLAGRIAADGDGHAWLTWANDDGVRVLRWGATDPQTLAPPNFRARPVIAANPRGDVAVAWRTYRDNKWLVHVAVKPSDAGFGEPTTMGSGTAAQDPVVVVTRRREVVVAWYQNGSPRQVTAAVAKVGEAFGEPAAVSSLPALYLRLIADREGAVTAAWLSFPGDGSRIVAATRTAGGSFGAAHTIASGGNTDADGLGPPSVAALPDGWLLAFRRGQSVFATRVIGTNPGPERTLEQYDQSGHYPSSPAVAADLDNGRAVVAWTSRDERVAVARRGADGEWSDVEQLSPAGEAVDTVLAAQADQAVLAWTTPGGLFASRYAPSPAGGGGGGGGGSGGGGSSGETQDVTPPHLTVRLAGHLHLAALLAFRARCDEHAVLRLATTLSTPQRRLGSVAGTRRLAARRTTTFHVRLPGRLLRAARAALRAHRTVTLQLTVRATDDAGNTRRQTRRARLIV